jgi:hypothetical protein
MMVRIGADGTMSARSDSCARVMDAPHDLDGGVYRAEINARLHAAAMRLAGTPEAER